MDEGLNETNISKPRIYIKNTGTEMIQDFCYYYYLTGENDSGFVLVLDDYYSPNSSVYLETLGGNGYRVKFDFKGVSLAPGQVLPDLNGNVIGLHYSDWTAFDKSNDFSCNGSPTFLENMNIPVYLNDERIYGFEPDITIPEDTTQVLPVPQNIYDANQFAVFGLNSVDLRDRVILNGASVGSNSYVEVGCDDTIYGNMISGGNILLRERCLVDGSAIVGGTINKQNNVTITGNSEDSVAIGCVGIELKEITAGTMDINIPTDTQYTLLPGNYKDVHIYSRTILYLQEGTYNFNELVIEPHVTVSLSITGGQTISLNVVNNLQIGDSTIFILPNRNLPLAVQFYTNQTKGFRIGTDCVLLGYFSAPFANTTVNSRTNFKGAIHAKSVTVEPEVTICMPPLLAGLSHSEGAYAPFFDAFTFDYTAVVPDVTSTITILPFTENQSVNVTVNGGDPSQPVNLNSTVTDISILLGGQCESETEYRLSVSKQADYQIFVNDDSPCDSASCDGSSWETAFKNLQDAIELAEQTGKEIWVAEGKYVPVKRIDTSDARTSTFLIAQGLELKGSFIGIETEPAPEGSPYETILSGDIAGNDKDSGDILLDPESSLLLDNCYHVVTVKGVEGGRGITLSGFSITGGAALGNGQYSYGGGIHIVSPTSAVVGNLIKSGITIERCVISKNIARNNGGGLFAPVSPSLLKQCLFKFNRTVTGKGGGIYSINGDTMNVESVVFFNNAALDTINGLGGALSLENITYSTFTNFVAVENSAGADGGFAYLSGTKASILNSTITGNSSGKGSGGLIKTGKSVSIENSIFWDNFGELSGDSIVANYSCISGGYAGAGNISNDPLFIDAANPEGDDGMFATIDDGLRLQNSSPVIGISSTDFPEYDIMEMRRDGTNNDLGAYTYTPPLQDASQYFGIRYGNDQFLPNSDIHLYKPFLNEWRKKLAANSTNARYIRIFIPDNKYTSSKSTLIVQLTVSDSIGIISDVTPHNILMKRSGSSGGQFVFYSDKPLVFVNDKYYVNEDASCNCNDAYYVYGAPEGTNYHLFLSGSQF
jgi:hypothetical protein